MARLTYTAFASLDGYVADADGGFGWAMPSEEVHLFANELEGRVGTHLLGRRMYETMAPWETDPSLAGSSPVAAGFAARWAATDKVVFSTTLASVATARTTVERRFDPGAVRRLKAAAADELSVGGAALAAQALTAGLVDEVRVFVAPEVVGSGTPMLPAGLRLRLELLEQRSFANGMAYLRYAARS